MRLTCAPHLIHTMSFALVVKIAVRGYHVYRTVWEPHVGEEFVVIQQSGNSHDRYTMAVYLRDEHHGVIVGHLQYHKKFLKPSITSHGTRLTWHSQGTWLTQRRFSEPVSEFSLLGGLVNC